MSVLRSYDQSFKDFIDIKLKGQQVPVVGPITPLRAFARVRDLLKTDPRVIKDDNYVPLPFISFVSQQPAENLERFRRASLRKITFGDDANTCTVGECPYPYDIPFQIDVWTEFADDARYIVEALLRKWKNQPMLAIEVDHGPPWGVFNVYAHRPQVIDNSDLESDDQDRQMRFTLTTTVEGFLSDPAKEVKTVRETRIYADVPDTSVEELLDTHSE